MITLSSVAGGKWSHVQAGKQALEVHQHTLFRYKTRFSAEMLGQNMLKNAYFLEKSCKIAAASEGPTPKNPRWPPAAGKPPQTPALLSHLLI